MRRNAATLIKYALVALLFFFLGPIFLKVFLSSESPQTVVRPRGGENALPQDPDFVAAHKNAKDLLSKNFNFDDSEKQNHLISKDREKVFNTFHFDNVDLSLVKDWHDYALIAEEKQRTGPGEQGAAVILSAEEEAKKDTLYKVNGFNALASDKISLDRALKDIRHPDCRHQQYLQQLPNVSVVVPFHNEHWSTLLRTVHSVLNHSPLHLIHEIILADDFSNKEHCGKPLADHVASHYDGKVKLVRAKQREGLIRARLIGARAATGQVLIFLDSHVEATTNWLPPLLDPIARDYRTAVCPFIDVVDYETFAYRAQDEGARGAFDWEFFYKRLPLLPEDLKHPARPFKSPVMAGGLFAISTKWFWELGGYDSGLDIWGGEQYELSFKIWMCGGSMVDSPCSRVGHVYRKFNPFGAVGKGDYTGRNYRRVAEVWMDEYAEYLYKRRPHYRQIDPGDLSEQRAVREKLRCKSFKWFMEEVAFDLPKKYPPVEPPTQAEGEIRNEGTKLCIDTRFKGQNDRFGLETCITDGAGVGGEQSFELTWHKDLRPRKRTVCFDVSQSIPRAPVLLYGCHGMMGNQHFRYNLDTHQLYHPISGQCLDCDTDNKELYMSPCNSDVHGQRWTFTHVNETAVRIEWNS